jgi:hypothetical protein
MIPRCKEFFIATADHIEWGKSHTVWGKVSLGGRGLTRRLVCWAVADSLRSGEGYGWTQPLPRFSP